MVFCMVALLLPESLWAQSASVSNGKLTITTNAGGLVSTYLGALTEETTPKLSEVKACTTLELIGYFTSEDLAALQTSGDDYKFTNVDMSEARFVSTTTTSETSSATGLNFLYHVAPSNPTIYSGAKAIIGGTLYKVTAVTPSWEDITSENPSTFTEVGFSDADKDSRLSQFFDDNIIKIVPANYYVLSVTRAWNKSNTQPATGTEINNPNFTENELDKYLYKDKYDNDLTPNAWVKYDIYNYWKYVITRTWKAIPSGDADYETATSNASEIQGQTPEQYFATASYVNENEYRKFATAYAYYQLETYQENDQTKRRWKAITDEDVTDEIRNSAKDVTGFTKLDVDNNSGTHADDTAYTVGDYIRFGTSFDYYKYVWTREWQSIETSSTETSIDHEPTSADFEGKNEGAEVRKATGNYNYYQLIETRTWNGPTTSMPADKKFSDVTTITEWNEANINDYINSYENGKCIRFAIEDAKFYKKKTIRTWTEQSYTDGSQYNISHRFATGTTPNETVGNLGEYGVVNGSDYAKNGELSNTLHYDYSQMKFSYWSGSLVTATTSKYADNTINSQLFDNCQSLTTVNYLAGNVTGFMDKKSENGYHVKTVTFGKNVTSIDESAFLRCNTLETISFDNDYEDGNKDMLTGVTYPIDFAIGNQAFQYCTALQGIIVPNRVTYIGSSAFENAGNNSSTDEFTLYFERRLSSLVSNHKVGIDHDVNLVIDNAAFMDCKNLKTLELPIRLTNLGSNSFKGTTSLTSMLIREDSENSRLKTIPNAAFAGSGIQTLLVPKSVTLIEDAAFQSCSRLKTVTFQEQTATKNDPEEPLVIKSGAFAGGTETAVEEIILVDCTQRKLVCEYNAFNFTAMEAQTQEGVSLTKLKLASDDDTNFNYYVGKWKKGLAFSQKNLNAMKDGYNGTNGGVTYIGLAPEVSSINKTNGFYESPETTGENTLYAAANGWQQFASSTSKREVKVVGNVFMTYSSDKPYSLPAGLLAFRVSAYTYSGENIPEGGQMTLKNIGYLPSNTGVILISTDQYVITNGQDASIIYFGDTNETTEYPYQETGDNANLLVPAVSKVNIGPVSWGPTNGTNTFSLSGSGSFDHRNFGMHKTYHYFARLKRITMPDNRAFLSLPTTLFNEEDEGMEGGPKLIETTAGKAGSVYDPSIAGGHSAPLLFDYDLMEYGVVWPLGDLDMLHISQPTDIKDIAPIERTNVVEGIFTLQGVRVTTTTPGNIYIINGKKVYVK